MGMGKRFADASLAKIASVEKQLSGIMRPVAPRKEFIRGLGRRIQAGGRAAFVDHVANWRIIALLIAGMVSVGVFLAMVIRALASLGGKKRAA
jgi:hypothetical protein